MIFRKKNKIEKAVDASEKEARRAVESMVQEMCYEIEAHRQIAVKTGLFTNDEFAEFMEDSLNEASIFFDDMKPEEILDERIANKMDKMFNSDNVKVIKVEL